MKMTDLLAHGRTQQKRRTRTALVDAARRLVSEGRSPTVEDAAEAAGISRTTAYRYFKNQSELLAEAHPETQKTSLLSADASDDPVERLDFVVKQITRTVLDGEVNYRTMLRLSLDPATAPDKLVLRQGRAIAWIEDALAPLRPRFSRAQLRRLTFAIRSAIGIEAFVWLVDVAGQSREEAVKTMRWSARAMLRGAMNGEL
jgi:AcrR family transcriptional regulator